MRDPLTSSLDLPVTPGRSRDREDDDGDSRRFEARRARRERRERGILRTEAPIGDFGRPLRAPREGLIEGRAFSSRLLSSFSLLAFARPNQGKVIIYVCQVMG